MIKKVHIATSREVGHKCISWAKENLPVGFVLVEDSKECDIFISILYDKILSPDFLESKQCFNFHPGILSGYRGAGAYSWAIINEETKSGVTLHLIDKGIDSGDIIEIREFPIIATDTAFSLWERGNILLQKMFRSWFKNLLNENYTTTQQVDSESAIYYRKDLNKAKDLTRFIRGLHFPGKESSYYLNNQGVKVYLEFTKGE